MCQPVVVLPHLTQLQVMQGKVNDLILAENGMHQGCSQRFGGILENTE